MIYMPGGRSLVNNSIFNLVLMLAGFSPTSIPLPPHSRLCLSLTPCFQFSLLYVFVPPSPFPPGARSFSFSFYFSFIPSPFIRRHLSRRRRRRPDKDEISTASVNKFLQSQKSKFAPRSSRSRVS